jgi:hypothetical protein
MGQPRRDRRLRQYSVHQGAPNVLRGMGLTRLVKNENAKKELAKKGMAIE